MNDLRIIREPVSSEDYNSLCRSIGWGQVNPKSYATAVANSIACVHAADGERIVGFARLVGDKGMYVYVQDLLVDSQHQGRGIGTRLVHELETIVTELEGGRGRLTLIAAHDVRDFYNKMGYRESRPPSSVMTKSLLPMDKA